MAKNICTIIAKNYISFARVLCSSFLEHHPDGKCYVLIIDDFDDHIDESEEKFEIVRAGELSVPRAREFCFKYNITELATAFKPYLLSYLFESRNLDRLLYLDPDILVTHPLDGLYEALEKNDIIVTPHLDTDYPDDGLLPNDSHIMLSGIYNLGFIGMKASPKVATFLAWWQRKLYDKCVIEHAAGYFVDQKFIDLAQVLFPCFGIILDTGYNAAYWNLHSRRISRQGGDWMCNDGPLYFFHFSNFKPEKPETLSGHQNRYQLKNLPQLQDLFNHYCSLLKSEGYDETKRWPYGYGQYADGKPIRTVERMIYRKMLPLSSLDDPFDRASYPPGLRIGMSRNIFFHRLNSLIGRILLRK